MNEDLKDHDVLVVKEKSSNELSVPNNDKNGELTAPPFIRVAVARTASITARKPIQATFIIISVWSENILNN